MDDPSVLALDNEIKYRVPAYPATYRGFFLGATCMTPHAVQVAVDYDTPGQITLNDLLIYHWMTPSPLLNRDRVRTGTWNITTVDHNVVDGTPLANAFTILTNPQGSVNDVNRILHYETDQSLEWNGNVLVIKHCGPSRSNAPTHVCDSDYELIMTLVTHVLRCAVQTGTLA